MNVQAILDEKGADVATVGPEATVPAAAARMRLKNIASLVVMRDGRMAGIVSERDIVAALVRHGSEMLHLPVAKVMTEAVTCRPEDDLGQVMKLMTRHRARHLPVMSAGELVGIISIGDVVKHRLQDLELETAALRDTYFSHH